MSIPFALWTHTLWITMRTSLRPTVTFNHLQLSINKLCVLCVWANIMTLAKCESNLGNFVRSEIDKRYCVFGGNILHSKHENVGICKLWLQQHGSATETTIDLIIGHCVIDVLLNTYEYVACWRKILRSPAKINQWPDFLKLKQFLCHSWLISLPQHTRPSLTCQQQISYVLYWPTIWPFVERVIWKLT